MQSTWSDVLFDDAGQLLQADSSLLARRLGVGSSVELLLDAAVRVLGFIRLNPLRGGLLVTLSPPTVSHLAAYAAFYFIAEFNPCRVVLASLAEDCSDVRHELFPTPHQALTRVQTILAASGRSLDTSGYGIDLATAEEAARRRRGSEIGRLVSFRRRDGLALRVDERDVSTRIRRPLEAISVADSWIAAELANWQAARERSLLPSIDSIARRRDISAGRGRAHIVDTSASEATGYWFRHWAPVNSYAFGETGRILGQMSRSLMRDNAIEDYWSAVQTGVPMYQLIRLTDGGASYAYARLLLPFASDGRHTDHLLVLINERDLATELPEAYR